MELLFCLTYPAVGGGLSGIFLRNLSSLLLNAFIVFADLTSFGITLYSFGAMWVKKLDLNVFTCALLH